MTRQDDEAGRLTELQSFEILDTPPEEEYDRITRLAARLFDAPIALVSLVDDDRQWFKSHCGLETRETPRSWAFCEQVIQDRGVVVVKDAQSDPRFKRNPLVTGSPHIRFYCGAPLKTATGHVLGSLCVIDREPRDDIEPTLLKELEDLAKVVVSELELRRSLRASEELRVQMQADERMFKHVLNTMPAFLAFVEPDQTYRFRNDEFDRVALNPKANTVREVLGQDRYDVLEPYLRRALDGEDVEFCADSVDLEGNKIVVEITYTPLFDRNDETKVLGVATLARDVTENRLYQRAHASLTAIATDPCRESADKLSQILHAVLDYVQDDFGMVGMYKDDHFESIAHVFNAEEEERHLFSLKNLTDWKYWSRRSVGLTVCDENMDREAAEAPNHPDVTAYLAMPLRVAGETVGLILTARTDDKPRRYSENATEFVRTAAAFAANEIALQRNFDTLFDYQKQLIAEASTDYLSNLCNRRHFMRQTGREFDRSRRYEHPLSLIMIDIDHFKRINDQYGHDAGDLVIKAMGKILARYIRRVDIAGRLGGEEFAVLLPETEIEGARAVAEKILDVTRESEIETAQGSISFTVSIGVATLDDAMITADELIRRADEALYEAKRGGRDGLAA